MGMDTAQDNGEGLGGVLMHPDHQDVPRRQIWPLSSDSSVSTADPYSVVSVEKARRRCRSTWNIHLVPDQRPDQEELPYFQATAMRCP